jgi:dimeric dUTPase (all-alpha-NTP-PPase superfamily)
MNWDRLFEMQKVLDERIKLNHQLHERDVVPDKLLALLVELGELANETRCFKFWSQKGPNEKVVILEEYVDGLHFILSLGLELNYSHQISETDMKISTDAESDLTAIFIDVYKGAIQFQSEYSFEHYNQLFATFLKLGEALGFTKDMIQEAYVSKNEINHERQEEGY